MYDALVAAINHPDAVNPYWGLFNRRIIGSLATAGPQVDVVSPRPFAPPVGPYSEYARLPAVADWGAYDAHHPRFWYFLPKRLLYGLSGKSYANRIPTYVEQTFDGHDVVHACHIYPDGYGMLPYARAHDIPLFVVAHGKLLNDFDDLPPTVAGRVQQTLDEAAGVLCVSDALAEKARARTDPSKVTTVPIGADPGRFPVDQRASLRAELGFDPEQRVVLFVGQFSERKGIEELAELLPELDLADTTFVFVGSGGDKADELKAALAESQYTTRHVYTGLTSLALRRWFVAADLLLLPSHAEGRPTVIYEAMASATPVLASDVGGVAEQVVDGETGVLLPPGDVDALGRTLAELTANRGRLERLGAAGLERLQAQGWTWEDHSRRVQELHRAAIDGEAGERPSPQVQANR
jgi:glycosyltransferase involved in cell wall biosynthesis